MIKLKGMNEHSIKVYNVVLSQMVVFVLKQVKVSATTEFAPCVYQRGLYILLQVSSSWIYVYCLVWKTDICLSALGKK